jgi:anti-sigma regulatory factor (Ser/Thr protein kinase)
VPRSGATSTRDHAVVFYDRADRAVERLTDYVAGGLRHGDAVIAVLTPEHAAALHAALRTTDAPAETAAAEGWFVVLDAAETLSTFLVDGFPDRTLLADRLGDLLGALGATGRSVRAAGEMVAVLWDEGNVAGALALEEAWNELADLHGFSLLCPYPAGVVTGGELAVVGRLCELHSEVVAPETYASAADDAMRTAASGVFVPSPEAVGATRRLVAGAVTDWSSAQGVAPDQLLLDDACLVASEMAANAVTHAHSAFEVTVTCSDGSVRVAVSDTALGTAEAHEAELMDVCGRGLAIVDDVADRWGCDHVPGGKVVWAELTARPS